MDEDTSSQPTPEAIYLREWRAKHPGRSSNYTQSWRARRGPDGWLAEKKYQAKYRARHRAKIREYARQYYQLHRDEILARRKEQRQSEVDG